jgi:hypothetical protein
MDDDVQTYVTSHSPDLGYAGFFRMPWFIPFEPILRHRKERSIGRSSKVAKMPTKTGMGMPLVCSAGRVTRKRVFPG